MGGTEIVDTFIGNSWDESIIFYGLKTVAPVMFGNKTFESTIVYYIEDVSLEYFFQAENIWGITGNAYFFNNVVIIDYKNNKFGVK